MRGDSGRRAAVASGGGWLAGLAHRVRHERAHAGRAVVRRGRYLHGVWEGRWYRLTRYEPDYLVGDDVLADRVRSSLGVVAKRLDVPQPHVMVTNHVVSLHGEVGTVGEALTLAGAAGAVPGVLGVDSRLHVGLLPGHGRPSQSRLRQQPATVHGPSVPAGCRRAGGS
jgi:hypothetical protein